MPVELTRTDVEITRRYEVTGEAPMSRRRGMVKFIPQVVEVQFLNGEFWTMIISGGYLRKDGTAGAQPVRAHYFREPDIANMPEWARPLTRFP